MAVVIPDAYWSMEAPSGNESDSTAGGRTLTATNAPGSGIGIVGNCRTFVSASSQIFSRASDATLAVGDVGFTLACWAKKTVGAATYKVMIGKGTPSNYEYLLWFDTVFGRARFTKYNSSGAGENFAGWTASHTSGVWYFVTAGYNKTAGNVWIRVNNGTRVTTAKSITYTAGTAPFSIGGNEGGGFMEGSIDEVAFWRAELSDADLDELYNGGVPLGYAYWTPAVVPNVSGIRIGLGIGI